MKETIALLWRHILRASAARAHRPQAAPTPAYDYRTDRHPPVRSVSGPGAGNGFAGDARVLSERGRPLSGSWQTRARGTGRAHTRLNFTESSREIDERQSRLCVAQIGGCHCCQCSFFSCFMILALKTELCGLLIHNSRECILGFVVVILRQEEVPKSRIEWSRSHWILTE